MLTIGPFTVVRRIRCRGQRHCQLNLHNKFRALDIRHKPPRPVSIPRAVSASATARRLTTPLARYPQPPAPDPACASALATTTALSAVPPLPARLRAAAPLGLPSLTLRLGHRQRFLGAPGDRPRSACATSAMMPTVKSLASGMSPIRNRTHCWLRFGGAIFEVPMSAMRRCC